jgi:hypothetical protein
VITVQAQRYISPRIPLPASEALEGSPRALIEFHGVELAGPSFEARVFLNNPQADVETPTTPDSGYVGSFHVYGYGVGPSGASLAAPSNQPAASDGGPLVPTVRTVDATGALQQAARAGATAQFTVVPVFPGGGAATGPDLGDVLKIQHVAIRTPEA